jgi:hypothetical protein
MKIIKAVFIGLFVCSIIFVPFVMDAEVMIPFQIAQSNSINASQGYISTLSLAGGGSHIGEERNYIYDYFTY